MVENQPPTPPPDRDSLDSRDAQRKHPGVQYEEAEMSVSGVVIVLTWVAVVFAVMVTVGWWFVQSYAPPNPVPGPPGSYSVPSEALPATPRLEQLNVYAEDASANVFELQLAKEKALQSFGESSESGFIHLPIDEAIKLQSTKLPVQTGQPAGGKSSGLVGSGEPNSGRLFQETRR